MALRREYASRTMPRLTCADYRGAVRIRPVDLGVAAIPLGRGAAQPGWLPRRWSLALMAVFSVPLYWGRRYPLGVLLVVFAAGLVQVTAAALSGARRRARWSASTTSASSSRSTSRSRMGNGGRGSSRWRAGSPGRAAGATVWLGPRMSTPNVTVGLCVLFAPVLLAWAIGTTTRTRRAYLAGLVERADRLERERQALALVAVAEERERIARELHDIVAHSVSLMVVASDGADAALEQREHGRGAEGRRRDRAYRAGRPHRAPAAARHAAQRPGAGRPQPGAGQLQGPHRERPGEGAAQRRRPASASCRRGSGWPCSGSSRRP